MVREEAEIYDDSMVRGTAVVAGKARIYDHAVAKDSCYISSGEIKDDAVIAGKAIKTEEKYLYRGRGELHGDTLKLVKAFQPGIFDAVITDASYASGGTK